MSSSFPPEIPSSRAVIELDIDEALQGKVDQPFLESVLMAVLSGRSLPEPLAVELVITDDEEIQGLNHEYRGKDTPTDVLSFPLLEYAAPETPKGLFPQPPGEPLPLGDIVISYERAVQQAEEYGHSVDRELAYLVVHGVLHLLGYDHEDAADAEVMRGQEEAVLQRMGLTR